ncbi:MAG: FHA domain-containing protein [Myxococcales bacterium]|nr:FHA domain-containing protein [Myxococcales bacterium]MCB9526001.1 FHA domain-containing protein [Myxococcales bacterium]
MHATLGRRAAWLCLALITLLAAPGVALAQTTGGISLRLDAIDLKDAARGDFVLYTSYLDKYRRSLKAGDAGQWSVFLNGEAVGADSTKVQLLREDPEHGVAVVLVIARYSAVVMDGFFKPAVRGASNLVSQLSPNLDQAAVLLYSDTVDASGRLTPILKDVTSWLDTEAKPMPEHATPSLLDAVDQAVKLFPADFGTVGPNRVVVVVTDGFDKNVANPTKTTDMLKGIEDRAGRANVRINVIGTFIDTDEQLPTVRKLAGVTGGTYRQARTANEVEEFLNHTTAEINDQHVIRLHTTAFEGGAQNTFHVEVTDDSGHKLPSGKVIKRLPEKESHVLKYVLFGVGGLVALLLFFLLGRAIVRAARNRGGDAPVAVGPETTGCRQCGNRIDPSWKVCKYCEALPHHGRLTVTSSGPLNGKAFFIKESQTTVGKDAANHIVIDEGSVSKRHAGISVKDHKFELQDFASTNKTWVNGQEIHKQFLKDGDEVGFGAVKLVFKLKK